MNWFRPVSSVDIRCGNRYRTLNQFNFQQRLAQVSSYNCVDAQPWNTCDFFSRAGNAMKFDLLGCCREQNRACNLLYDHSEWQANGGWLTAEFPQFLYRCLKSGLYGNFKIKLLRNICASLQYTTDCIVTEAQKCITYYLQGVLPPWTKYSLVKTLITQFNSVIERYYLVQLGNRTLSVLSSTR